ncbi:MAG TPA: PEGA domain-containing protein, partial [Gemmatimonadales bacterium]|nr:PEGA domain-containing protein [Gemmatimonadales bacterium]
PPRRPEPPPVVASERRAEPGLLSINAIPWGSVYVDGRPVGNTPQLDLSVPPGQHRLRVERQGYRPYERVIDVAPGQRLRITDITLVER